jgi:hypothetical protein
MSPRLFAYVSFWIGVSVSGTAFAWGDLGHETVAMIASDNLTPDARAFVEKILGPEPMSIAAIWPDQVREDRKNYLPFAAYHLCDVTSDADLDIMGKNPKKTHDCFSVLVKGPELLNDPTVSDNAKRIIMRYLIHVAGDVHQPLHIGNGLDLGGNLCDIRLEMARGAGKKANLHSTWDTALVEGLKKDMQSKSDFRGFYGSTQLANEIQAKRAGLMKTRYKTILMSQEPIAWLRDSADLRKKRVYPDDLAGVTITDERQRPYCKYVEFDGRIKVTRDEQYRSDKIPLLTKKYQLDAQELISTQLLKAGLRLAGLLNRTAPKQTPEDAAKQSPVQEVFEKMRNTEVPATTNSGETK